MDTSGILAEELAKIAQNPLAAAHLGAMIAEIRHRLITPTVASGETTSLPDRRHRRIVLWAQLHESAPIKPP